MDSPAATAVDSVLAQPTRARLFALLGELRRPAGTAELAGRLGLHPNGVRVHLERLEAAGVIRRLRERQVRGRPRDMWSVAAAARPGGHRPTAYQELGRWLARATPAGAAQLRRLEGEGRQIGREIAPRDATGGPQALDATLAALGFQPTTQTHADGRLVCRLGNCPYRDAVRENQPAICALHRGMTRGLVDELVPGARLTQFVPGDPDDAGCIIVLEGASSVQRDAR